MSTIRSRRRQARKCCRDTTLLCSVLYCRMIIESGCDPQLVGRRSGYPFVNTTGRRREPAAFTREQNTFLHLSGALGLGLMGILTIIARSAVTTRWMDPLLSTPLTLIGWRASLSTIGGIDCNRRPLT
jgi:hypothetical protein